jgi:hypothetical protein
VCSSYCLLPGLAADGTSLSGKAIEVIVGLKPPTTLIAHENLVCASSVFFNKAMSQDWKEAKERSIKFEDEDPDVFQLYLHWLYRGTLPVRIDEPGQEGNAEYLQLAKACVLGDKLQDGDFQDVIIDAIVDKCKSEASDGRTWFPVGPVIQQVYDNTLESSKARRLLTDLYISHGSGSWLREWIKQDEIPRDFLFDVAIGFLDRRIDDPTKNSTLCEYHQHG